jgi:hypothetical protein
MELKIMFTKTLRGILQSYRSPRSTQLLMDA